MIRYFSRYLLVLSTSGVVSIIVFKIEECKHMKFTANTDNDINEALDKKARIIITESKLAKYDQESYNTGMEFNDLLNYCSSTLLDLLLRLTPKFFGRLSSALSLH